MASKDLADDNNAKNEFTSNGLERALEKRLVQRQAQYRCRELIIMPPGAVDFSSNNYLSLSTNPTIHQNFLSLLQETIVGDQSASSSLSTPSSSYPLTGFRASRLLDGTTSLHLELESLISNFHHARAGLLFNSGFEANIGLFSSVPQSGDVAIIDESIHASVHDGLRQSRATTIITFAHNLVEGPGGLRESLQHLLEKEPRFREGRGNIIIAVESVYSMEGDVAPLRKIVDCVEELLSAGNSNIIVDEAHSIGLFGERGRGLVYQLGLEDRVWARVHTLGKAIGCSGTIVLCSSVTKNYLINFGRNFIFTTAISFPALASIKVAYDYIISGEADQALSQLWKLIHLTDVKLRDLCAKYSDLISLHNEPAQSAIIPLFTSFGQSLAASCQKDGFMVHHIIPPAVPVGKERIRICLHANNTEDNIHGLVRAISKWADVESEKKRPSMPQALSRKSRL